ncbi:MAG: hypothetical protein WBD16_08315 [Pyrinomonadaceae bacterium]
MLTPTKPVPKSWLAFDLNVLRRLKFSTAALPFTDSGSLGAYLKRWQVRVAANDPLQSAWTRGNVHIANNRQRLSAAEVNVVLEDAYVPGYRYQNPGLTVWFNETDSWWFDNVRRNIDKLSAPMSRAIAASIVFTAGDYVLSFKEETRELRQPLSNVFRRLWSVQPEPFENQETNTCDNKNVDSFIAETPAELMFLRLPTRHTQGLRNHLGRAAWREEWIRGGNEFWDALEAEFNGRLGSPTETKSQYLHQLDETLRRATHMRNWAIAHVETGFIQTQDIVDCVSEIRRVDTIYTKDFSELTGTKAVIITA